MAGPWGETIACAWGETMAGAWGETIAGPWGETIAGAWRETIACPWGETMACVWGETIAGAWRETIAWSVPNDILRRAHSCFLARKACDRGGWALWVEALRLHLDGRTPGRLSALRSAEPGFMVSAAGAEPPPVSS